MSLIVTSDLYSFIIQCVNPLLPILVLGFMGSFLVVIVKVVEYEAGVTFAS